jgi:hypothetical protein
MHRGGGAGGRAALRGLTPDGGGGPSGAGGMAVPVASAGCPLALQWVDVTEACTGRDLFQPRCAHSLSVLPATSALSASTCGVVPCSFVSIGGCSESEYFPLAEVCARMCACVLARGHEAQQGASPTCPLACCACRPRRPLRRTRPLSPTPVHPTEHRV